ncbi:MAG: hypothetical protein JO290_10755 [Sphingomonadaceae bacterium]|nr:hypothetical protein [Sphingomonadaceae bacterium]
MAGKTASLVRQAIPKPGMVAGALRGAATGAAVAPVYAGTNAALAGENPLRAAGDAFMNPAGVAVGAALGAAGGKAQGTAAKIRDPKTMTGRTIADVEAAGGRIKPLGRPVEGGLFDSPEVAGLQEGRAGINEAAGNARDTILEANQKKLAAARAEYGESVDKILAEHGGRRHLVDNTHARLNELEAENTVNGEVLDEHLDRAIKKVRRMTEAEAGNVVVPAVKVEDLIKIKKGVNRLADWKAPVSPENRPYREIARSLDKDAAAIDPRIGEMNKAYKAALEPIEETHGILLGGRRKTDVKPTDAQLKGAALKLGRVGDDTQAATTDDVARLRALSPENDRAVRTVAAKKALERLRYGANETSTSIEKGMANAAERGAAGKVGAVVGEAAGGLPGAAVGYAAGKAAHALATPAGRVRLVLPAAEAAARAEQRRTPNVLVQMALEKKRREQELARRLGGGAP